MARRAGRGRGTGFGRTPSERACGREAAVRRTKRRVLVGHQAAGEGRRGGLATGTRGWATEAGRTYAWDDAAARLTGQRRGGGRDGGRLGSPMRWMLRASVAAQCHGMAATACRAGPAGPVRVPRGTAARAAGQGAARAAGGGPGGSARTARGRLSRGWTDAAGVPVSCPRPRTRGWRSSARWTLTRDFVPSCSRLSLHSEYCLFALNK